MRIKIRHKPNVVKDMVNEEQKRLEHRAKEILDQREKLHSMSVFWSEIRDLSDSPGWANLLKMLEDEIEKIHNELKKPMEPHLTDHLRGSLKSLFWLSRVPSLAGLMLHGVKQQEEAQLAQEEEFVQAGA
jgi:hypothetical protein